LHGYISNFGLVKNRAPEQVSRQIKSSCNIKKIEAKSPLCHKLRMAKEHAVWGKMRLALVCEWVGWWWGGFRSWLAI